MIDSTGFTSGIDSFAIRWPISDGGSVVEGRVAVDGFVRCGETCLGGSVRVVDLSSSINFLTVSVILGWVGMEDLGRGDSEIFANGGAEICGGDDFGSACVVSGLRDIFGVLGTRAGFGISGRLRLSVSSILEDGRALDAVVVGCAFRNGVTVLNDGRAGAGFTAS